VDYVNCLEYDIQDTWQFSPTEGSLISTSLSMFTLVTIGNDDLHWNTPLDFPLIRHVSSLAVNCIKIGVQVAFVN